MKAEPTNREHDGVRTAPPELETTDQREANNIRSDRTQPPDVSRQLESIKEQHWTESDYDLAVSETTGIERRTTLTDRPPPHH
ncbi:hypothetical protein EVAR_30336_1 [Eumeta japonica]|uniref:Uncharacterized protein n=1 Tax=Eumeta variegata TaxID=151549 RepID=A0A4C1WAU7_EUMVA|nr:hypothetical protein EVAR_30336_1 [Eumeta japonica]